MCKNCLVRVERTIEFDNDIIIIILKFIGCEVSIEVAPMKILRFIEHSLHVNSIL